MTQPVIEPDPLHFEGTPFETDFALVRWPDEILRRSAANIDDPTDPNLPEFLRLLDDARLRYRGIGIAAPQIGLSLRIAVIKISGDDRLGYGLHPDTPLTVLINPEIVDRSEKLRRAPEACLSVPGYEGILRRPDSVVVETLNTAGDLLRIEGDKLFGRALQHEIDHLDGHLYVDRAGTPEDIRKVDPLTNDHPLLGWNPIVPDGENPLD